MFTRLTTFPIYLKRSNVTIIEDVHLTLELFKDSESTTDLFIVEKGKSTKHIKPDENL
jgi:hypothetical protein